MEVFPDANIVFMNNTALMSGGAIYVTFPAIRHTVPIFNRQCFLQYDTLSGTTTPLYDWQVYM
jgi:predicted outer membrane repeat protein